MNRLLSSVAPVAFFGSALISLGLILSVVMAPERAAAFSTAAR